MTMYEVTMFSGIFGRTFLVFGGILSLALIGIEFFVADAIRVDRIASLRDNLAVQARLIATEVPFGHPVPLDGLCRRFKGITGARVTIIDEHGRVLGDSDHDSAGMDNHRTRTEIQQAALAGAGMAIRHSDTLDHDLLYVAVPSAGSGRTRGFIRLSVSLTDVDASIDRIRTKIGGMIIATFLIAGIILFWQIERLRRLTRQVRDFSSAIADGDLGKRLFLPSAGEFDTIAGSLNDMAVSLQNEISTLQGEKTKFETALLGISDGVLLVNRDGRVELANRAFRDLFGISDDMSGKRFMDVVRHHQLADIVREAHEHHRSATAEIDIALPRQLFLLATALPIIQGSPRDDRYHGTVVALHDITQIRQLEQVRKDFVANVSHEIKTPMTAISGFADTLLEGALKDPEHARAFLETIRSNSRRINSLVDDLMTISKIEMGVIRVEKTDTVFADVADAVLAILKEKAAAKGLSLVASRSADPGMVSADRDRLVQILTNLVDNAVKFTETGRVTFGLREEEGRRVIFVEDTGIGIPAKHLPRLGERFYRVDAARSRIMGGTGLGLAIVKHLVKAHGWEMNIESVAGKGTTVRITIA